MADDERMFQLHEVTGEGVANCDPCGRPIARESLIALAGRLRPGDGRESVRVCPRCLVAIERDELPLTDEEGIAGEPDF
jgi:hypothetical protein